jgi:hypothetical protein
VLRALRRKLRLSWHVFIAHRMFRITPDLPH